MGTGGFNAKPGGGVCSPESFSFAFKLGGGLPVPAKDVFELPNQPRKTGVARAEVAVDPDGSGFDGIDMGGVPLLGMLISGRELGIGPSN